MKKLFCSIILIVSCIVAMAQKPLIGISTGYSASENTASVRYTYVDAVINAGGIPVLIPLAKDSLTAAEAIERIDGLILSGGEDVHPFFYGEEPAGALGSVNAARDKSDMWLLQSAAKLGKAVLSICRGEQLTNVTFGGTLYQDLSLACENPLKHRQDDYRNIATHHVHILDDSMLQMLTELLLPQ